MKVFLIRHAESMQNTKENYKIGLPDHKVYLSEKGKKQAEETGEFLKKYFEDNNINVNDVVLWVSPYERTRETASIINRYLGIERVYEDITLIEQRYGLFSDKEIELIKEKYPEEFKFYNNYYENDGRFYAKLPQGESAYDVALRTKQFIDYVVRDEREIHIVVSHGITLRTIIMNWFHHSPEWFNSEPTMDNAAVRLIEKEPGQRSTEKYIFKGPKK